MKHYSIGQFSRMMGINAQTLRYYEKMGIIHSLKSDNGYRYYTDLDSRSVMDSRRIASLGFSLDETKSIMNGCTIDSFKRGLMSKQKELEFQSAHLLNTIEMQKCYIALCDEMLSATGVPKLESPPEPSYWCGLTKGDNLFEDSRISYINERSMELLPMALQCVQIEKDVLLDNNKDFVYQWGILIYERFMQEEPKLKGAMSPVFSHTQWASYISRHQDMGGQELHRGRIQPLLDFIGNRGYGIAGDAMGTLLPSEYGEKIQRNIKFLIPITLTK